MKRICALLTVLIMFVFLTAFSVKNNSSQSIDMTINFNFGDRTGEYSGDLNEKGLPDGFGTFTSKNTSGTDWTYSGEWKDGHWEGIGTTKWEGGTYHAGQYTGDEISGYGVRTFEDGSIMLGKMGNGTNGLGIYVPSEDYTIVGNFVDGDLTGYCAVYLTGQYEGFVFWGNFENGEAEGTVYVPSGKTVEGHYKDGQLQFNIMDVMDSSDTEKTEEAAEDESKGKSSVKNSFHDMVTEAIKDAVKQSNVTPAELAIATIKATADKNFDYCEVDGDPTGISMSVGMNGLANLVETMKAMGYNRNCVQWSSIRDSAMDTYNSILEIIHDDFGLEDTEFSLTIVNDTNVENALLMIYKGKIVYDVMAQ